MKKSTIFIIVLVVILAFVVAMYFYTAGGKTPEGGSLLSSPSGVDSSVGAQELALLKQVQSINIDAKFFTSPLYASLVDYSQSIPDRQVGRSNPFAPVPGVPSPFASPVVTPAH